MSPTTHDVIATCPVCENELAVTRLACTDCGTTIEGRFTVGRFGRLNREQLVLLESFLRSRGNLRDMERELGLSYPTVRGRVEALVRALDLAGPEAGTTPVRRPSEGLATDRRRVLEQLARHEIAADEAALALRALGDDEGATDA